MSRGRPIPANWAEQQIERCLDKTDAILQDPKTRLFAPRESVVTGDARVALRDLIRQRDEATANCATWRKEAEKARASVADLIRERDEARRLWETEVSAADGLRGALREIRAALGIDDGCEYRAVLDAIEEICRERNEAQRERDEARAAPDRAEQVLAERARALEELAEANELVLRERADHAATREALDQERKDIRAKSRALDMMARDLMHAVNQNERLLVGLRVAEGAIRLAMTDGNAEVAR